MGCCGGGAGAEDSAPELVIVTHCGGLDVEQLSGSVTEQVELRVAGLPSVARVRSLTLDDVSVVTLELAGDADVFAVKSALLESIAGDLGWVPDACMAPQVGSGGAEERVVASLTMVGEWEAVESAATELERALLGVAGVEEVRVQGLPRSRVRVALDPHRAAVHDVSMAEVIRALEGSAVSPGTALASEGPGSVEDLPAVAVATKGEHIVLLGDLATVELETPLDCGRAWVDGAPAAVVTVLKAPDTPTDTLAAPLAEAIDAWRAAAPPSVELTELPADPSLVVEAQATEIPRPEFLEPAVEAASQAGAQPVLLRSQVPRSSALECDDSSFSARVDLHWSGPTPEGSRLEVDRALDAVPGLAGRVVGPTDSWLEVELSAPHFEERRELSEAAVDRLTTVPGLLDVYQDSPPPRAELRVSPERERLAAYGLSEADVADTVRLATDGLRVGEVARGDRRIAVVLALAGDTESGDSLPALRGVPLLGATGGAVVPLQSVARIEVVEVEAVLRRVDHQPVTSLFVRVEPLQEPFARKSVVSALQELELPAGAWVRLVE